MQIDRYGLGRVVGERGVLPQRAQVLDPVGPVRPGEVLIDVESLNIDAASFKQLKDACAGDAQRIGQAITEIVRARGKMQNPVTGSGGMLIGRVRELGPGFSGPLRPGDRVATLVSLTLTPLSLSKVKAVHVDRDRVDVEGTAVLFASGVYALLPGDLPETLVLAALDVCGAPALVARHAHEGMTVGVLGAGKSGALCLAQARRSVGPKGRLVALDVSPRALAGLRNLGLCDDAIEVDATNAVEMLERVDKVTGGRLFDLTVNCASVPNTEMASILATRQGGKVIFFSMATSFTAAALGAEGVGKDVTLLIGNGFVPGHADLTLALVRDTPGLRELFEERYV